MTSEHEGRISHSQNETPHHVREPHVIVHRYKPGSQRPMTSHEIDKDVEFSKDVLQKPEFQH